MKKITGLWQWIRRPLLVVLVVILCILIIENKSVILQRMRTGRIYVSRHIDPPEEVYLLEWGWDTPYLNQMPEYIDLAQQMPFDGIIFDVQASNGEPIAWTLWQNTPIPQSEFDAVQAQVGDLEWGRLTENFLRLNIFPADLDWYDDHTYLLENLEKWARLANTLGFRGVVLDTEQYRDHERWITVFDYGQRPYNDQYSFQAYSKQVYQRGQEVIQALNRGYPGMTILLTYSLSILEADPPFYRLLKPFVDGMIKAADKNTVLVDGYEISYRYQHELEFLLAYELMSDTVPRLYARHPERYREISQVGFGLWIDSDCKEAGLSASTCHFSSEEFQHSLDLARRYTDRYVWIYSERINWYTGDGLSDEWHINN